MSKSITEAQETLLLAGLLGLLLIDQPGFEQLIAKGKTHVRLVS